MGNVIDSDPETWSVHPTQGDTHHTGLIEGSDVSVVAYDSISFGKWVVSLSANGADGDGPCWITPDTARVLAKQLWELAGEADARNA